MRLPIVKIGCVSGVRLPLHILKQCGIDKYVSMEIDGDSIVISAYTGRETPLGNLIHIEF